MQTIPESEFEYHRAMGEESGYPPCCIKSFLQGRTMADLHEEYSISWDGCLHKEEKIFGKVLNYVPCKECCEKLAAGGER